MLTDDRASGTMLDMRKVFYSWQSDLQGRANRNLILSALEWACKEVGDDAEVEPVVDRDTLNVPGSPNISETIFAKIEEADAFVADVSIINPARSEDCRPSPNPNVLVELGYATRCLGHARIILVLNTHYGTPEMLPFDLRQLRVLTYESDPDDSERAPARKALAGSIEAAIRAVAEVARPDAASDRIYRRTMNIVGQAEGLLRDLSKEAGETIEPESMTREQLEEICKRVNPNGRAPLVVGGNPQAGGRHANWLGMMTNWRDRSRRFTEDLRVFDQFLDREHFGLLADIEQCSYFNQLEHLGGGGGVRNGDLSWLASSIWEYAEAARRLRDYAIRHLRR